MTLYFILKWLHVLGATVLFGTGLGIAFFMWMTHRRGNVAEIVGVARLVVLADACFTAPAVVLQLITGVWLMRLTGFTWTTPWLFMALLLFVLVGACWLPVVWMQWRARDLALRALADGTPLPPTYHRLMRWWFWLGWPAFIGVLAIVWLMVAKPD